MTDDYSVTAEEHKSLRHPKQVAHEAKLASRTASASPRPIPTSFSVTVRRTISPKAYNTVVIGMDATCELDPAFTLGKNLEVAQRLLSSKVDQAVTEWLEGHPDGV